MSFREEIRSKIGEEYYAHFQTEAEREVAIAIHMPLKDHYGSRKYYCARLLLREFDAEYERLNRMGLNILPLDIIEVLFRCKLLKAAKDGEEFGQRVGSTSFFANRAKLAEWGDKDIPIDTLEDRCVSGLQSDIRERTLLTHLSSFTSDRPQLFFDDLFAALGLPFLSFVDEDLTEKHKHYEQSLKNYDIKAANEFFSAPSIGYMSVGTENYCFWQGITWLRTFLNVLRIAAFIHPGQREFVLDDKLKIEPPSFPVFLGMNSQGCYQWAEDKKESWRKLPDGCLYRSWGFRGVSKMWLDRRNFSLIKKFMLDHRKYFYQS